MQQENDVFRPTRESVDRTFSVGDAVWAMNFQAKPKWIPGVLEEQAGPVSFTVRLADGRIWRRHQDHLRIKRPEEEDRSTIPHVVPAMSGIRSIPPTISLPPVSPAPLMQPTAENQSVPCVKDNPVSGKTSPQPIVTSPQAAVSPPQQIRRSSRMVKPPVKLNL